MQFTQPPSPRSEGENHPDHQQGKEGHGILHECRVSRDCGPREYRDAQQERPDSPSPHISRVVPMTFQFPSIELDAGGEGFVEGFGKGGAVMEPGGPGVPQGMDGADRLEGVNLLTTGTSPVERLPSAGIAPVVARSTMRSVCQMKLPAAEQRGIYNV